MKRTFFIIGHFLLGAAAIAVFSAAITLLWNWLMPAIFGWTAICFWQALGLLALCRILFGSMGVRFGRMKQHHRNPIREKWMNMTPEEQKEFLKNRHLGFGRDCGHDFFHNDRFEK